MLSIQNLTFFYPHFKYPVIRDLSATIDDGCVYGLLGPNGAGKSTLLYLIAGLLNPKSGEVLLNGVNTRLRKASTLADIFLVPEEFDLPRTSLMQYARTMAQYYPNFSIDDLRRHLDAFGFPGDFNIGALSMGQKKKVYMCIALAANTPLLLMDEPTNGLDIPSKASFRSFIASNMNDERTVIISTHQVADVSQIIDHVMIMNQNSIIFNQSIDEIIRRLVFATTIDPLVIEKALYSQPDVQGMRVVLPNDGDTETEVDLELLFQLATTRTPLLTGLFSQSTKE